jgi:MinD superfamily P-loop ATPase
MIKAEIDPSELIKCRVCSKFKSRDNYYVKKTRKMGVETKCKACISVEAAQRYQDTKQSKTKTDNIRARMKKIPTKIHYFGIFHGM